MLELVVSCPGGLQGLVQRELESLGAERCSVSPGAVRCAGTWETVWRANRELRCGRRVLVGLADWRAFDGESLRAGFVDIIQRDPGLRSVLRPARSIAVHGSASGSRLKDGRAIAGIVRSALLQLQERATGQASEVVAGRPDLPLRVRVHRDVATLFLDTSGWPLDGRGGPERRGEPRASVCAALTLAAGWDGQGALLDPFAGDGRVLEEAVAVASGWSPNRRRESWPFKGLESFDPARFAALPSHAGLAPDAPLYAGDPSQRTVRELREWGRGLQIDQRLRVRHTHLSQLAAPTERGLLVSAPPADLPPERWSQLGEALKHRFPGWTAALLCQGGGHKHLGLRPRTSIAVRDGGLQATLVVLELWAGRRAR